MKVYGIVNCNTVKAARAWLDKRKLAYDFVDFKKTPPTQELLARWCGLRESRGCAARTRVSLHSTRAMEPLIICAAAPAPARTC